MVLRTLALRAGVCGDVYSEPECVERERERERESESESESEREDEREREREREKREREKRERERERERERRERERDRGERERETGRESSSRSCQWSRRRTCPRRVRCMSTCRRCLALILYVYVLYFVFTHI